MFYAKNLTEGYCKLDIANVRYRITLSIEKIPDAIRGVIDETSGMLASVPKSLIPEGIAKSLIFWHIYTQIRKAQTRGRCFYLISKLS